MKKLFTSAIIPLLIGAGVFALAKGTAFAQIFDQIAVFIVFVCVLAMFILVSLENKKLKDEIKQLKGGVQ